MSGAQLVRAACAGAATGLRSTVGVGEDVIALGLAAVATRG